MLTLGIFRIVALKIHTLIYSKSLILPIKVRWYKDNIRRMPFTISRPCFRRGKLVSAKAGIGKRINVTTSDGVP